MFFLKKLPGGMDLCLFKVVIFFTGSTIHHHFSPPFGEDFCHFFQPPQLKQIQVEVLERCPRGLISLPYHLVLRLGNER